MGIVENVQSYLGELALVDGSTAWPSVRRRVHDEQGDQLVIITEDGGRTPQQTAPGVYSDAAMAVVGAQVRVRGAAYDGDGASAKAREIIAALHGASGLIGDTEYIGVAAATPEPVFIGYDSKYRPEFTVSFRFTALTSEVLPTSST
jgi:hypothetical protein